MHECCLRFAISIRNGHDVLFSIIELFLCWFVSRLRNIFFVKNTQQFTADHYARWPLCKLWEHRFSVPDLVSALPPPPPPPPLHWVRPSLTFIPIFAENTSYKLLSWNWFFSKTHSSPLAAINLLKISPFWQCTKLHMFWKNLTDNNNNNNKTLLISR